MGSGNFKLNVNKCYILSFNLRDYVPAPALMQDAVDDLLLYHQLRNQSGVKLYLKWKGKNYFKGTGAEWIAQSEMKELLELSQGKLWEPLIKAIYLTKNYSTEIDLNGFDALTLTRQTEVMDIIVRGMKAQKTVTEWLKPIAKKDTLDAIYDSVQVTIGEGQHIQFQVLKLANIPSTPVEDGRVGMFDEVLEIDNPEVLIEALKHSTTPPQDQLILTFQRNKKYEFKQSVFMFLIWKNALYVIESSERRLNVDNTSGARRPDRYLERQFEHVWLPFNIIVDGKGKKTESTMLAIRNQRIFKRGSLREIFENSPETNMWLQMLLLRVVDHIMMAPSIPEGITPHMAAAKMLEDLSKQPIAERIKSRSQSDASSYLVKKYGSKITALTIQKSDLPAIIGTRQHVTDLIRFQQRQLEASQIEKALFADWKQNAARVIQDFKSFVRKQPITDVIQTALMNREYPIMVYSSFGGRSIGNKTVQFTKPTLTKTTVLELTDTHWGNDEPKRFFQMIWTDDEKLYRKGPRYIDEFRVTCQNCRTVMWKKVIVLTFQDYRQVCAFFNVKETDLPHEIIEHLHMQNDAYIGNSILDDVDPMDIINDPWFRKYYRTHDSKGKPYDEWTDDPPKLEIIIPVCNRCIRKLTPPTAETHPHEGSYITTIKFGNAIVRPAEAATA